MNGYGLKPCPFCGGKAELITTVINSNAECNIKCQSCGARTRPLVLVSNVGTNDEPSEHFKSFDLWNRRA